jgi:Tfp pilus assembly protein PilF
MSYKSIKADPTNANNLDTYAWILFNQERYEEAKTYIEQAIANDSVPSSTVLEHAGDIYANCDDMEKAMEYWQKAYELGDGSPLLARKIKLKKYIKEK